MRTHFVLMLVSLFLNGALLNAAELNTQTFVEADGKIVLWDDFTIPAEKSYKSIVVIRGNIELEGKTENLVVVDGHVHLVSGAEITNKIVLVHGQISREEGSKVPESVDTWNESSWWHRWENRFGSLGNAVEKFFTSAWLWNLVAVPVVGVGILIAAAIIVLLGSIIFFIAPRFSHRADRVLRTSPFISVLWGLAGFLSIIPIAVIMVISIVGILVIPFYFLFVILVAFAGLFAGFRGIGTFLMSKLGVENFFVCTVVGLVVAFALSLAPIIGQSVFSLLWLAGVGALLRSLLIADEDPRFIDIPV